MDARWAFRAHEESLRLSPIDIYANIADWDAIVAYWAGSKAKARLRAESQYHIYISLAAVRGCGRCRCGLLVGAYVHAKERILRRQPCRHL